MDSTSQIRLPAVACDVFQADLSWQGIAKLYKGSIFVITETHVDATIMRCFQAELFSHILPSSDAGHVNLAGAKP